MAMCHTIINLVQCESRKASVQFQNLNWLYFHCVNSLINAGGWAVLGHRCIDANVRRCDWKQSSNLTVCARMKNMVTCCWEEWGEEKEEEAICQLWHSTLPQWKNYSCWPCLRQPFLLCNRGDVTFHHGFIGLHVCICILWRPHSSTYCVTHQTPTCLTLWFHDESFIFVCI